MGLEDVESVSEPPLDHLGSTNQPSSSDSSLFTPTSTPCPAELSNPALPTPDATADPPTTFPPPPPPPPQTSLTMGASREIIGDVGAANIFEGSRIRKPSQRQAYEEDLRHLDDYAAFHATYAAALR